MKAPICRECGRPIVSAERSEGNNIRRHYDGTIERLTPPKWGKVTHADGSECFVQDVTVYFDPVF